MIGKTWETAGVLTAGTTQTFGPADMDNIYGTWYHGFFSFTAAVDSEVTFITDSSSSRRTDLDVMIGPDWDNGYYVTYAVGSNFDNNHAGLFFAAQAGVTYHIVYWASAPEPADTFQLIVSSQALPALTLNSPTQPQLSSLNSAWGDTWRGRIYSFTPTADSALKLDSTGTVMSDGNGYVWFDLQIGNDDGVGEYVNYWQLDYDGAAEIVSFGVRANVKYHLTFWANNPQPSDSFTFTATNQPLDLTPPLYRIAGQGESSIAPAGGGTLADATIIHESQISQPSLGVFNSDQGRYEAWWKFEPTRNGELIFDGLLSYPSSPFSNSSGYVYLYIWFAAPGDLPTFGGSAYGDLNLTVTVGYTYWFLLTDYAEETDPPSVKYLRVSDYGVASNWIDRGEQTYVLSSYDNTSTYFNHTPDLLYHTYGNGQNILTSAISANVRSPTYEAGYGISRSFAGPYPHTVYAAIECAWHHTRVGESGGQLWGQTVDVGFLDYVWQDTGCNVISTDVVPRGQVGSGMAIVGVGYSCRPDIIRPDESMGFSASGSSAYISLLSLQFYLTKNAGLQAPTVDYYGGGGTIEYEDDHCTLTGLDVAADEALNKHSENESQGGYYTSGGYVAWDFDGTTRWFGGLSSDTLDAGVTWGPVQDTGNPYYGWYTNEPDWNGVWNTNNGGPESLTYDFSLPDYAGGAQEWTPVADELFQAAYALEQDDSAWYGPNELDFTQYSSRPRAGLKFVAISPYILSPTIPAEFGNVSQANYTKNLRRWDQCLAVRVHVKPSRFRVLAPPTIPTVVEGYPSPPPNITGYVSGADRRFQRAH